jgi:hypothetical protein
VITLDRGHALRVVLTSQPDWEYPGDLGCTVEATFEPSRAVAEALRSLANNRLPPGHPPINQTETHGYIDPAGNIRDNYVVPLHLMPQAFRGFVNELSSELHDAAEDVVGALRWRSRTLGPRNPFSSRGIEWALDGEHWKRLPASTHVEHQDVAQLAVMPDTAAELQTLLDRAELEPLAHALYREAWSQRRSNPSSSLLIGMAALEIGVKHYIAACVPAATWLVENVPSPPIAQIIQSYLPSLDPPGGSRIDRFDDKTIQAIRTATTKRNELAHRGVQMPHDLLLRTLRVVRNVLWTLDVARGHSWAAEYVSPPDQDLPVGYRVV